MKHLKIITKLGIPLVLGSVLQILMNTMDMMFVSRLGTSYAAASAMGTSIAGVVFVFSMLISAGAIALVSQKIGSKDEEGVLNYSGNAVFLSFLIGLCFSVISLIWIDKIINIYDPKPELMSLIKDYVSILFIFNFVVFMNSTLRNVVQGTGDTKGPLYIFGAANLINILLDYIFIMKLDYGIKGAALATVISQTIACIFMLRRITNHIYQGKWILLIKSFKLKLNIVKDLLRIGIWACIQSVARPITGMIMMGIVYKAGSELGSAAFGIGLTLINYFFIMLTGLSGAITILVGQKVGGGYVSEAKEIVKEGIKLSWINFIIFLIPFFIFPEILFIPFQASPEVVVIGKAYLRWIYASLIVVGYTFMYRGAFSGTGQTYPPMLAALFSNVVIKVGFAYGLATYTTLGLNGVWIAIGLSVIVEFVMIHGFYRKDTLYKSFI
ncbi:MAG: MATE family efflux transporter [Clostridia bacterium]|nr:MATE family efflux transporter [Clostridia bacterium]